MTDEDLVLKEIDTTKALYFALIEFPWEHQKRILKYVFEVLEARDRQKKVLNDE